MPSTQRERGNPLQELGEHPSTPCRTYCPLQATSRGYRGILFPSMLILTAPCSLFIFFCSAKRRLCFSSRVTPFLYTLYRGPITAQLVSSLPVHTGTDHLSKKS